MFWTLLFLLFGVSTSMQRLLDQRQNLKFLVAEGLTPIQCWEHLHNVYGVDCMSKPTVRRWHIRFQEGDGHTPVTNLARAGRPKVQSSAEKVDKVQRIVSADRRVSLKEVAEEAGVSITTAHRLLKGPLKLKQKISKWVPRVLTDEQKRCRKKFCEENLQRLQQDPHLLDKLVCGDESPVYLHNPESKLQSAQWLPHGAERPQKALCLRSQKHTMLTAFFDARGVILIEYSETSVDTDSYIETLRTLKERIRQKRPFMWKGGLDGKTDREFIIQHNNASCHTSVRTLAFIFDQDMLAHPPYSPDLAPCDYFLFPLLKSRLHRHKHRNLHDLKTVVTRTLNSITEAECQGALCKLPLRWRKCVMAEGEYFEGRCLQPPFDPYFDLGPDHQESEEEDP